MVSATWDTRAALFQNMRVPGNPNNDTDGGLEIDLGIETGPDTFFSGLGLLCLDLGLGAIGLDNFAGGWLRP